MRESVRKLKDANITKNAHFFFFFTEHFNTLRIFDVLKTWKRKSMVNEYSI